MKKPRVPKPMKQVKTKTQNIPAMKGEGYGAPSAKSEVSGAMKDAPNSKKKKFMNALMKKK